MEGSDRETPADDSLPQPIEVLEHHRAVAESALNAATCGHPLCRIGDGPEVGCPKHAEGGLAAVGELQRKLCGATGLDALSAAEDRLAGWEAERSASEDRGAGWVAYRNGGVARLIIIVADLAEVASS